MDFTTYVRKPFTVEAIEITRENIEELAPLIGTLRKKENGTPFIQVDRRLVPNVFRVYPGYWMTKMEDNIRCYAKRVFHEQFVETDDEIEGWINYMRGNNESDVVGEEEESVG